MEKEMDKRMTTILADNIISPLGFTSRETFGAVAAGESRLRLHDDAFGLPEPVCASLLSRDRLHEHADKAGISTDMTLFERLATLSALDAVERAGIDPASPDTLFILSTTKGNVDLLASDPSDPRSLLSSSARRVAGHFGNSRTPLVVSNACISGVCAQIAAARAIASGRVRTAVVTGADILSRFIVSGFQSFKALSPEPCRPYDSARRGLNLGEGAATMVISAAGATENGGWEYRAGSIHNDANHISGPSRTGEGAYLVLEDILAATGRQRLAFVNAHGTATNYNDEMESIALHRARLCGVPLNALKGVFGHTLGAAGVLETVVSMKAVEAGIVLPTRGYGECGVSHSLDLSPHTRPAHGDTFIKMLSGFGGSNAAVAWTLRGSGAEKGGEG